MVGTCLKMEPKALLSLLSIGETPPFVRSQDAESPLEEPAYQALFRGNAAALILCSTDGAVIDCNPAAAELLGFASPEELAGTNFYTHLNVPQRQQLTAQLEQCGTAQGMEIRLRRTGGPHLWLSLHASRVEAQGQSLTQITAFDITQPKLHEQSIADSEAKFRSLADPAASAIYIHDGEHFLFVK